MSTITKNFTNLLFVFCFTITSYAQCVSTLAGSGTGGLFNGTGTTAQFNNPTGIAIDGTGNIYIADTNNNCIRKITPSGSVSTLLSGYSLPGGVAIDASGSVYISVSGSNRILKVTQIGNPTITLYFAGSGVAGFAEGNSTQALLNNPLGICLDSFGSLFIADSNNHRIRKTNSGSMWCGTLAGFAQGFADGDTTTAQFNTPGGVAVDATGNVYVADKLNHRIRLITPNGIVTTIAGSGVAGFADGNGSAAQFNNPSGIAVDASGNVYVADKGNNRIRKISPNGIVTTIAGSGVAGYSDGFGINSKFNSPTSVIIDGSDNLFVTDSNNNRIRKISQLTAQISYSNSPFCKSISVGQAVSVTGTGLYTGGTFSSTVGLSINTTTGAITPSTSTAGTYTVNYTSSASGGCSTVLSTTQVTITALPTATISYIGNPFCKSVTTGQLASLTGSGTYIGGSYSSSTGLTLNSSTGAIIPSTSTTGTYTVTYTTPLSAGCQISTTRQIAITAVPTAIISYSGSPFCQSISTSQSLTLSGTGAYTGGTFSSTSGLSINSSTGAILPSSSTPGTYTVTYTTPASGGCATISTTTQVTILAPNATANINYPNWCYGMCSWDTNVLLTGTGPYQGGVFSSDSAGLAIDPSTGQIFPMSSQPGNYNVYYNLPSNLGCLSSTVVSNNIFISPPPQFVNISYSNSSYCDNLTTPQQVIYGGQPNIGGGSFFSSSPAGLNLNSWSGEITPSGSIPGTYTVQYVNSDFCNNCNFSSTTQVTITAMPSVNISYPASPYYNLTTTPQPISVNGTGAYTTGTYSLTAGLAINPTTGAITPSSSNLGTYTVTYTIPANGGCSGVVATTQVVISPQPNIGNLSLSSSTTSVGLFDTITVDVQLNNATNLYSLYMKLKGNAAVSQYLDYSGHTAGTLLGTNVISTAPTVTNGVPDFGMTKVGAVPGYSGSGLFYSFRFVPKNNVVIPAGTTFCFYLDNVSSYNASGIPCNLTNQGQYCYTFTNQVAVWPGDLNKSNTVTTADILPIGYFYNSTGAARANATIQWNAQPATLWGYNRTSTNSDAYKVFADSNGDGVINNADQAAIGFNMNQVHNRMAWQAPDHFSAQAQQTLAVGSLTVTPNSTIINGAALPQSVTFTVSVNNTGGLSALYGMSVNLGFDNTVFDLSTATVDYTGSIFGNAGSDCLALNYNSDNTVSVGLTRFGNAPINGQGLLFKVTLQTKTTLPNLTQTPVTAYVDAANNQAGDTLVIQDAPATNFTIINNLGLDTIKQGEFVLYPNPASEVIYLQMGANTQLAGMKIKVVNLLGQVIEEQPIQNSTTELSTKNWGAAGVYFVQITNQNNTTSITKKVMVNRK